MSLIINVRMLELMLELELEFSINRKTKEDK